MYNVLYNNIHILEYSHVACDVCTLSSQEQTLDLYKVCLDLIQSYTKTNTSKYSRAAGIEEEEQCDDLLHFLKMMTHLTIKDYVDFGDSGRCVCVYVCVCVCVMHICMCVSDALVVKPVDVVITGLNAILPLMTEEILKVHTHTQTHTHSLTHTHARKQMHTYIYTYMYMYTSPLSPSFSLSLSPSFSLLSLSFPVSVDSSTHSSTTSARASPRGCPLYQTSSSSLACTCWRVVSMTTVWR